MNNFYEMLFLFRDFIFLMKDFVCFMLLEDRRTSMVLIAPSVPTTWDFQNDRDVYWAISKFSDISPASRTGSHVVLPIPNQSTTKSQMQTRSLLVMCPYGFIATRGTRKINLLERIYDNGNIGRTIVGLYRLQLFEFRCERQNHAGYFPTIRRYGPKMAASVFRYLHLAILFYSNDKSHDVYIFFSSVPLQPNSTIYQYARLSSMKTHSSNSVNIDFLAEK